MKTTDSTEPKRRSTSSSDRGADELGWEVVSPTLTRLKQIEIDDVPLTYTEQGSGELVVLLHGALGDYRTWSQQATLLARQYHVISYSRRYHQPNPSTIGAFDYTYRRHVDDLISLIHTLGLGPAHLVGHSYGAAVAALLAMERPELVNSLILGEPSLFSILSDPKDKVSLRIHRTALNVVHTLSENGEQRLAVREYLKIVTGNDTFDDLPIESLLVITQNAHTLAPMLRTFFAPLIFDQHQARGIKTPTLVVTGECSPTLYRAIGQELARSLPNSELLILAGASHGLQMENPADFNVAVLEFLSRNELAGKREDN
jgi:pimeloyl-ACP methyl ester carboxylesterase